MIIVKTSVNSEAVELYGVNGHGVSIPLDEVDRFIEALEKDCSSPQELYKINLGRKHNKTLDIPGSIVGEISRYLREARDSGWDFKPYEKTFE